MKSARGEIAILGCGDHTRNMFGTSFAQPIADTHYCTRNSRNNAIVLRPLRAIASHELLHELLRWQTTIAATPLAESTPSQSRFLGRGCDEALFSEKGGGNSVNQGLGKDFYRKGNAVLFPFPQIGSYLLRTPKVRVAQTWRSPSPQTRSYSWIYPGFCGHSYSTSPFQCPSLLVFYLRGYLAQEVHFIRVDHASRSDHGRQALHQTCWTWTLHHEVIRRPEYPSNHRARLRGTNLRAQTELKTQIFADNHWSGSSQRGRGVGVKFPILPVNCSYLPLVLA